MPRTVPQNPIKKQLPASTNEVNHLTFTYFNFRLNLTSNTFKKFFDRLNFYSEEHTKHHKELYTKYIEEEAYIREQQMVVQHRLDTGQRNHINKYDGQLTK
jgi:hypothetical protein